MIGVEASHDGLRVSFADGLVSVAPWESVVGVGGQSEVVSIEVDTPYEAVIRTRGGDEVEIPWDFARHFGDADYRDRMAEETLRGQRKFGERPAAFETGGGYISAETGGSERGRQGYNREDREGGAVSEAGHHPEVGGRDGIPCSGAFDG